MNALFHHEPIGHVPQTGDNTTLVWALIAIAVAALAIATILIVRGVQSAKAKNALPETDIAEDLPSVDAATAAQPLDVAAAETPAGTAAAEPPASMADTAFVPPTATEEAPHETGQDAPPASQPEPAPDNTENGKD